MAALSALLLLAQATAQPAGEGTTTRADSPQAAARAASETADAVVRWRPYTREASRRFGVPLAWIERVMRAESGGRTTHGGRPITSPAGAMGLMQIMPATWAELRLRLGLGNDPHDPKDNILAGTFYLRLMYDRFGYPGLFGAYNAGPGRYAEWLSGRRTLPAETVAYLASVGGAGSSEKPQPTRAPAATAPPLFAVRHDTPQAPPSSRARTGARSGTSLFVALSTASPPAQAPD